MYEDRTAGKADLFTEAEQFFAYEKKGNSAVIWRCFSRDTRTVIPQTLDGLTVTALAPYAFSAHMEAGRTEKMLSEGTLRLYVPPLFRGGQKQADAAQLPAALCGTQLQEVFLPQSMRQVGRYCFYNCAHLHRLHFYGTLEDWGSGVFTGCHQVQTLWVYADCAGRSFLKTVLDELPEALEVRYFRAEEQASLLFPEFFEEGVENTPARILETHIHGSGIRYRNCFRGRIFDFGQYDAIFPYAKAQETPEIVARLVLGRLRFPVQLEEGARAQYQAYLRGQETTIADQVLASHDARLLSWFLQQRAAQSDIQPLLEHMLQTAGRLGDPEAVSRLMEFRRSSGAAPEQGRRRHRFEL